MPTPHVSASLRALLRHPRIRAVVRLDTNGTVLEARGEATCIRTDNDSAGDATDAAGVAGDETEESVYIRAFGQDYLVVVFDDEADFDPLKVDIDATLEQLG